MLGNEVSGDIYLGSRDHGVTTPWSSACRIYYLQWSVAMSGKRSAVIRTTYNLRYTTYDIRRTSFNIIRTSHDIRYTIVDVRRKTYYIQNTSNDIHNTPYNIFVIVLRRYRIVDASLAMIVMQCLTVDSNAQ